MKQTPITSFLKTLSANPKAQPDDHFRTNARIRLLNRVRTSDVTVAGSVIPVGRIFRWLGAAGTAFAILGTGVVYAAQSTIPGDSLYSVKIISEQVASAVAPSEMIKTSVVAGIIDRRASEIVRLEDSNQEDRLDGAVDLYKKTIEDATQSSRVSVSQVEEHIADHERFIEKVQNRKKGKEGDTKKPEETNTRPYTSPTGGRKQKQQWSDLEKNQITVSPIAKPTQNPEVNLQNPETEPKTDTSPSSYPTRVDEASRD